MALIKNPKLLSEEQEETEVTEALQFLRDEQQNITLKIKEILSLKDVIKGAGLFAMRELDPDNLEALTCSDPEKWPPISITKTNRGYLYYDGQHRTEASKLLKRETIQANCKTFDNVNTLIEAAFRANLRHGLQAGKQTKSDYCYWLSVTYPELHQEEIAKRVGVTQSTVSRAIIQRKRQLAELTRRALEEEEEKGEENVGQWKEGLMKRTKNLLKLASKFSETEKTTEEYTTLVHDLQLELLREPEDRQLLTFVGQLLLDAAKRSRK